MRDLATLFVCAAVASVWAMIPSAAAAQRHDSVVVPEGMQFVGSVDGRVYYRADCSLWRGLLDGELRFFRTGADASRAGYRHASVDCWGRPATVPAPPQSETWTELFEASGRKMPTNDYRPIGAAPGTCDIGVPDRVVLVTDGREGYLVLRMFGRTRVAPTPARPDTLTVQVLGTACQAGEPNTLYLIRGDHFITIDASSDFVQTDNGQKVPEVARQYRQAAAWEATARAEQERRKAAAAKRQRMEAKGWPSRAIEAVMAGKIYIGMTAEMVRESWGKPRDVNRTITATARMSNGFTAIEATFT